MKTTNQAELKKFEEMAEAWWDPNGKFKPLHKFNPVRIQYIRDHIIRHFKLNAEHATPLDKITLLDIGCGGGLISEPFCRMGATVTGIDAVEKNTQIAKAHAEKNNLKINYKPQTVEELANSNKKFDVVFALEIIEHVENPAFFIESCLKCLKKNGLFFGSTLNRTLKSYFLAIIGAEYVLGWLPKGTHEWKKFVTPHEFISFIEQDHNTKVTDITGVGYSILKDKFYLDPNDLGNNYMLMAIKK